MTETPTTPNLWLAEVLAKQEVIGAPGTYEALLAREDEIADRIRQIALQQGLILPMVNLILSDVGLGTPLEADARAYMEKQINDLMQEAQQGMVVQMGGIEMMPTQVLVGLRDAIAAVLQQRGEGG